MSSVPTAPNPNSDASCPICRGSGEVAYIDEDVGGRVVQPCWRCPIELSTPRDAKA